jgi:hypothetical protein
VAGAWAITSCRASASQTLFNNVGGTAAMIAAAAFLLKHRTRLALNWNER